MTAIFVSMRSCVRVTSRDLRPERADKLIRLLCKSPAGHTPDNDTENRNRGDDTNDSPRQDGLRRLLESADRLSTLSSRIDGSAATSAGPMVARRIIKINVSTQALLLIVRLRAANDRNSENKPHSLPQ